MILPEVWTEHTVVRDSPYCHSMILTVSAQPPRDVHCLSLSSTITFSVVALKGKK